VTAFVPNSAASAITTSSSGSSSPKPIKVGVVPEPREIAPRPKLLAVPDNLEHSSGSDDVDAVPFIDGDAVIDGFPPERQSTGYTTGEWSKPLELFRTRENLVLPVLRARMAFGLSQVAPLESLLPSSKELQPFGCKFDDLPPEVLANGKKTFRTK
jgi:hypothetical protein